MSVPTEINRIKGLRNDIRSRLIQIGALGDPDADLEACRDAMANVSTLTLSSIAITTPPDKVTYSPGETFDPTGMVVTAYFAYGDTTINFNVDDYTYPTEPLELGTEEATISYTFGAITKTATQEIGTLNIEDDLDDNSWATISWVAKHGLGSTYWNIGDRKAITLNGLIDNHCVLNNMTLYVYILDFNHPENGVPDNNIIFGGFFTAKTGGKDVCITSMVAQHSMGDDDFTIVRTPAYYYDDVYINGGWKAATFRYMPLGGTSTSPPMNGVKETVGTGYDASQSTISNPVSKTLMAALPADFRSVLRLRTHYTNNRLDGHNFAYDEKDITATVDAISLLTEFEVKGSCQYSSLYEAPKQKQMAYYKNGGSAIKYRHENQSVAYDWWTASMASGRNFCAIGSDGNAKTIQVSLHAGLAPVFKV